MGEYEAEQGKGSSSYIHRAYVPTSKIQMCSCAGGHRQLSPSTAEVQGLLQDPLL